jgi:hypothetical protein
MCILHIGLAAFLHTIVEIYGGTARELQFSIMFVHNGFLDHRY